MPHTLIYGGTFDPIHLGHLITCQRAAEILHADKVLLLPAQISPHKTTAQTSSSTHRLAMLKLAIENNPLFAADDRELHRPPPSYTFDTLTSLREGFPTQTFTLLIGQDQLPKLHTWHRIKELIAGPTKINFAVLPRPPLTIPGADYGYVLDTKKTSFGYVSEHLGIAFGESLERNFLQTPLIEISATDIRNRVAQNLPIDYLVPEKVAAYIHTHQLYRPIK